MRWSRDGWAEEQRVEKGIPNAPWVRDAVDPVPNAEFYLRAFWELSTERHIGFSPGAIPHSAIVRFAERAGLDEAIVEETFLPLIRVLDAEYLRYIEAERENRRQAGKGEPPIPQPRSRRRG